MILYNCKQRARSTFFSHSFLFSLTLYKTYFHREKKITVYISTSIYTSVRETYFFTAAFDITAVICQNRLYGCYGLKLTVYRSAFISYIIMYIRLYTEESSRCGLEFMVSVRGAQKEMFKTSHLFRLRLKIGLRCYHSI